MRCLAHSKPHERKVMASVIDADHQLITTGQVITADPGLASAEFERFCHEIGGHMLCPNAPTPSPTHHARRSIEHCCKGGNA